MEFPYIGSNCAVKVCNKLDFLPIKCDGCKKLFCHEHMKYVDHDCPTPKCVDIQVPVCPLCDQPVPSIRGQLPDIAMNQHIENNCQTKKKKVFSYKCQADGCKQKEVIKVECNECRKNFCISHRFPADHSCQKNKPKKPMISKPTFNNSNMPRNNPGNYRNIQGEMNEDEALAIALSLSLSASNENNSNITRQNTRVTANHCSIS